MRNHDDSDSGPTSTRSRSHLIRAIAVAVAASCATAVIAQAQTTTNDDPTLLRELALRIAGDGSGQNVILSPGALPVSNPAIVVPPAWRVIGTVTRKTTVGIPNEFPATYSQAFIDAPTGSADEAVRTLTNTLTSAGWSAQPNPSPNQSGFVVPGRPTQAGAQYCGSSSFLYVFATKFSTGPTQLNLSVSPFPPGTPSPCSSGPGPSPITSIPQIPIVYRELPTLLLPDGAKFIAQTNGGSQFSSSSGLTVEKSDLPSAIEAFFATQMATLGWQRASSSSSDATAISTWTKTVETTPIQAMIIVTTAIGTNRRDLLLTVSQEASLDYSNYSYSNYGGPTFPVAVPVVAPPTPILRSVSTLPTEDSTIVKTSVPKKSEPKTKSKPKKKSVPKGKK
jgi:hypothetical protein